MIQELGSVYTIMHSAKKQHTDEGTYTYIYAQLTLGERNVSTLKKRRNLPKVKYVQCSEHNMWQGKKVTFRTVSSPCQPSIKVNFYWIQTQPQKKAEARHIYIHPRHTRASPYA